jgi:glycosyltransferase involved in cell wall biosynthesis
VASLSILIPTRDRPEFLLEALGSVATQTHPELELIVVRDGGAPLTAEALGAIGGLDFPASIVEHDGDSEGAAVTRNRGLAKARADAVAFLDDDDLWAPDHASRLAQALDDDPDADVVYSDSRILLVETGEMRRLGRDFEPAVFVRDGFIPPSAMAARRSAFERYGPFDPEFTFSEDWEWLIRVARGGGRLRRAPGETTTVRIHAGGISALTPERLAARRVVLAKLAERYKLRPIEPKTFWEVAGSL